MTAIRERPMDRVGSGDLAVNAGELEALQRAWVTFLRQWTWQWFVTLTFRDIVHPEGADKRFRLFVSLINQALFGRRWAAKGQGIQRVRALELQRRGVIHFHALFAGVQDLRRLTWMDTWDELAGFARIEPIGSSTAVRWYVSKYVSKGGELDLGGPLVKPQLPLFP
jgi:hypothetical protein